MKVTPRNYDLPIKARISLTQLFLVMALLFGSTGLARANGAVKQDAVSSKTTTAVLSPSDKLTPAGGQVSKSDSKPAKKLFAKQDNKDALAGYMAGESVFPSFLKITLALIAVIAGIYLTLTLLKKAMGRKVSSGGRANAIQVIETCYLAPKRSITLVRIGSKSALLSVSDNAISTLLELSSVETSEIVEMVDAGSQAQDFRQTLSKAKQKIIDLGSYARRHREGSTIEQVGAK